MLALHRDGHGEFAIHRTGRGIRSRLRRPAPELDTARDPDLRVIEPHDAVS
jgi:hypothetical protein